MAILFSLLSLFVGVMSFMANQHWKLIESNKKQRYRFWIKMLTVTSLFFFLVSGFLVFSNANEFVYDTTPINRKAILTLILNIGSFLSLIVFFIVSSTMNKILDIIKSIIDIIKDNGIKGDGNFQGNSGNFGSVIKAREIKAEPILSSELEKCKYEKEALERENKHLIDKISMMERMLRMMEDKEKKGD